MFAANRRHSEGFMELAETGFVDHEQAPPHQRTHSGRALREVDRSQGTIRKVRTCEQFTQDTRTASNLTPENLPLSMFRVVCGGFLLNYLFTMLIRTLFFALPALAIAISGYAQMPATPEPSAPPANPAPIRSSRKLVPAQSVAAAKTPVGTPSESPSPPATVAPPQRKAGPGGQPVPDQDTVSRLQIFLDEHSFGPGKIDGRWGEFIGKALQRFQAAHGRQPSGQIDSALQQELQKISPVYTTYTLTDGDLHWVGKVPSKPAGMAQLKRILYRSALDYVAERYHADPAFIRKLNSGRNLNDLKKGSTVQVPNVRRSRSKLFRLCRICRQDQSSLNASLELIQEGACSIW